MQSIEIDIYISPGNIPLYIETLKTDIPTLEVTQIGEQFQNPPTFRFRLQSEQVKDFYDAGVITARGILYNMYLS